MSDKLAVLMEFNGYTKDELEAYLSLKFGSMTKGGMTASILSQSGYEKAKSVIFGQSQLNENQQIVLGWLKEEKNNSNLTAFDCIYSFIYGNPEDLVTQNWAELNAKEEAQVLEAFGQWVQEQEEE